MRYSLRPAVQEVQSSDTATPLRQWIQHLPESLRLSPYTSDDTGNRNAKPYSFEGRQLHVMYFVALSLLYRSRNFEGSFPSTAVIAASTTAGIFEDFLARDEVRYLNPVFTFYLLVASITLLSCYRYPELRALAYDDLRIISQAQEELKKKWQSAVGSIQSFEKMYNAITAKQKKIMQPPQTHLEPSQAVFFAGMDTTLCRLWRATQEVPTNVRGRAGRWSEGADSSSHAFAIDRVPRRVLHDDPYLHSQEDVGESDTFENDIDLKNLFSEEEMHSWQMNDFGGDWLFRDQLPSH